MGWANVLTKPPKTRLAFYHAANKAFLLLDIEGYSDSKRVAASAWQNDTFITEGA
jgi:hypothetical protein